MSTVNRTIETADQRTMALRLIESRVMPYTLTITDGKHRTTAQNKLQHMWMKEIAEQRGDMTPSDVRAYCKLTIGIPLLREQNEAFKIRYDEILKPMSYEQKMAFMAEPFDLAVTRLMSTKQKTEYLDRIFRHFSEQGIILTIPDDHSFPSEATPPASDTADVALPSTSALAGEFSPSSSANNSIEEEYLAKDLSSKAGGVGERNAPADNSDDALSKVERALLIECCAKFMSITVDEALDPAQRRGVLAHAKDAWKSEIGVHLHPKVASFFLAADAIITGKQKNRAGAIREFAGWLECAPEEIGG